eukprot:2872201-Alexandrium_andersonii.AAC.1
MDFLLPSPAWVRLELPRSVLVAAAEAGAAPQASASVSSAVGGVWVAALPPRAAPVRPGAPHRAGDATSAADAGLPLPRQGG